ncbi:protein FAM114A2 [Rhopalosiphum maidis]|uniref:protein FAM114A2 n=1 Tax=Rhopalosiphum maidis TaxID=43146 RepID=UPI000F008197|nr:protein FAM114A2 [Rhopalosiphum maidis]XP_026823059.1 protein FAM114A2 [Rhopalosiphum maidis]XP_026823060.1 protein FAM114A2 [Rhopalosiphum maidis]
MSDSEVEFESADEGSKDEDGWEIESDFDLPDVSVEHKPTETKLSTLPNVSDNADTKHSGLNDVSNAVSTAQSKLDKLVVNNDNKSGSQVSEIEQNEIKQTSIQTSGWGGWSSGWSVNSLLSTASILTNQVSQGLTNVIGAPAPEQLASVDKDKEIKDLKKTNVNDEITEKPSESILDANYFLSNVSQITKIVETTGSKIISGGLDTLETVGKKTLEVLQDGDPGLRKKRAMFFQNTEKINLSQVLQEAKEKSEVEFKQNNQVEIKKGYAYLLDSFQGLIHLESLELLSKQCQMKLQTVLLSYSGTQLTDIQDKLDQIKDLCYFDFDDDEKIMTTEEFKNALIACINQISTDVKTEKILKVSDLIDEKSNKEFDSEDSIHNEAISALAELTAAAMELFYKLGEIMMIDSQNQLVNVKAEKLSLLNESVCCRIRFIANKYASLLTKYDADGTSNNISDVYLESSNSSSYIQDAAQLLIPILQLSVI